MLRKTGGFTDRHESFQTIQKLFRYSGTFPDNRKIKSMTTIWIYIKSLWKLLKPPRMFWGRKGHFWSNKLKNYVVCNVKSGKSSG